MFRNATMFDHVRDGRIDYWYNGRGKTINDYREYKRRRLCPTVKWITSAPAQNSPHHILNVLNDAFIQRIFYFLDERFDYLLNAAEVCTRFQENAKKVFPLLYQNVFYFRVQPYPDVPINVYVRFLSIFGPQINTVIYMNLPYLYRRAGNTTPISVDREVFKAIVKYCGKSLVNLGISDMSDTIDYSIEIDQFPALEELYLRDVQLQRLDALGLPKLRKLDLLSVQNRCVSWISQTFPKLIEVSIKGCDRLNNEMLIEFLAHNPQLSALTITLTSSSSILREIPIHVPNLVELRFNFYKNYPEDVMHVLNLKELKILSIYDDRMPTEKLLEAMANEGTSIEELDINISTKESVQFISKLINLKGLSIHNRGNRISKSSIINAVRKLPALSCFKYKGFIH